MISYAASIGCADLNSYVGIGKEISRDVNNRRVKLGKNATDKRLVYEYLKDYPKGLTVCDFLIKISCLDADNKIRFRPRFSDLCTEGLVEQKKTICSVCGQKETLYLVCEV